MCAKLDSGDNVGDQAVFDPGDLVFEREFLFLEPTQGQLVATAADLKRMDGIIKITMLSPQDFKPDAKHFIRVQFGGGVHRYALP